jgi:hypothetical protein
MQTIGRIAQLVERLLYTQDVTGSSPVSPIVNPKGQPDPSGLPFYVPEG